MKQKKENLLKAKNNSAITLIALVITIIVLLILAGITIATLTGDNGLLTKVEQAKQANENATIQEKIQLALNEWQITKNTNSTENFGDILKKQFSAEGESVTGESSPYSVIALSGNKKVSLSVSEDGSIGYPEQQGNNGKGIEWTLYDNGLLEITGNGEIDTSLSYKDYKDKIKSLKIGEGITKIKTSAFGGYSNLEKLILADTITEIGSFSFVDTKIDSLKIPLQLEIIGYRAFYNCTKLTKIEIKNLDKWLRTSVSTGAYDNCSTHDLILNGRMVTSVIYPDDMVDPGGALQYCNGVKSVKLASGATSSGYFFNCPDLQYINIPESVTSFPSYAFSDCRSLLAINIPEGVTELNRVLAGCSSLESVVIPESVETIGWRAFYGCSKLKNITFKGIPRTLNVCFELIPEFATINVPWSEGEVANAPWGAYNAKINYNVQT